MEEAGSSGKPRVALMLQGGGALGAYHLGAFEALQHAGFEPDWVAGISIGAINAAIIAGNEPADRLAKLAGFWERISYPDISPLPLPFFETWQDAMSNAGAFLFGQPGFFVPRLFNPALFQNCDPASVSFYDTSPLISTLEDFVIFERINSGVTRLSLGATDIKKGEIEWFPNQLTNKTIGPEHVVASGSLPPGFPATDVDGTYYWDGGCVTNSPLEVVLDHEHDGHWLVFVLDLWPANGSVPANINDAIWRQKQIEYASRTTHHIDAIATKIQLQHAVRAAKQAQALAAIPEGAMLHSGLTDIVHIIYKPKDEQLAFSDAEFSRSSIAARRAAGLDDMRKALSTKPWQPPHDPEHLGVRVHRSTDVGMRTLEGPFFGRVRA